jgi:hypothetical protein
MKTLRGTPKPSAGAVDPIFRAALAAGLEFCSLGARRWCFSVAESSPVVVQWLPGGWLAVEQAVGRDLPGDALSIPADWSGPAKMTVNGSTARRIDLPLVEDLLATEVDPEDLPQSTASKELLTELFARLADWLHGRAPDDWDPPAAPLVAEWIAAAGADAAIDAEGSLRTVLKRKGCDGQVRIERRRGRLRFEMRLGAWRDVRERTRTAMRSLVEQVNSHTRLVRVVWTTVDDTVHVTAQVDLTGLPVLEGDSGVGPALWLVVLRAALDGLQLVLCRLGVELEVLADLRNEAVVEGMHDCRRS